MGQPGHGTLLTYIATLALKPSSEPWVSTISSIRISKGIFDKKSVKHIEVL
jgi:hypothetical protein